MGNKLPQITQMLITATYLMGSWVLIPGKYLKDIQNTFCGTTLYNTQGPQHKQVMIPTLSRITWKLPEAQPN